MTRGRTSGTSDISSSLWLSAAGIAICSTSSTSPAGGTFSRRTGSAPSSRRTSSRIPSTSFSCLRAFRSAASSSLRLPLSKPGASPSSSSAPMTPLIGPRRSWTIIRVSSSRAWARAALPTPRLMASVSASARSTSEAPKARGRELSKTATPSVLPRCRSGTATLLQRPVSASAPAGASSCRVVPLSSALPRMDHAARDRARRMIATRMTRSWKQAARVLAEVAREVLDAAEEGAEVAEADVVGVEARGAHLVSHRFGAGRRGGGRPCGSRAVRCFT